ncbi:TIGR03086 family protein [Mycolicibacterium sp. P1-18]|uniref:TIGR03086 family metal-binding protein n=1 Tax=Mycolicibacterium sp. P1-18 TaxID=2024615 RepID=UPI0011F29935|nr:TIGR03086 family metal-binding protein [Mycolicibacterium sp. P1-18]KAA0100118.1 TIGR03086 family protein [Mycolicibacterium sp. P1-18]
MNDKTLLVSKACARTTDVLTGVTDDQLDARTPCEKLTVRELVAHVGGLGVAFAAAARKHFGELTDSPPGDGGYELDADWRSQYPLNLASLANAWRDPAAWDGMTRVGGVDLPGEVCGMVGLTEVVVHGWDVAVATGQGYVVDDDVAEAVREHLASFTAAGPVEGLFDSAVEIGAHATVLERAVALSGRDPRVWA